MVTFGPFCGGRPGCWLQREPLPGQELALPPLPLVGPRELGQKEVSNAKAPLFPDKVSSVRGTNFGAGPVTLWSAGQPPVFGDRGRLPFLAHLWYSDDGRLDDLGR